MIDPRDPVHEQVRVIVETRAGREFLRVGSILARDRPDVLGIFIESCRVLVRESVRRGFMHRRTLEEIERLEALN